jgi:hypothetical protein
MKDSHLTLRLPSELARALARRARARGVPKSQLAREAVIRYLEPGRAPDPGARVAAVSAAELSARWPLLPRLLPDEAAELAADIAAARDALPAIETPWA